MEVSFKVISDFCYQKRKIVTKYGFRLEHCTWFLVKPTTARSGSFFPLGGFRNLVIKSRFVGPGETKLEKKPFDELRNF